MGKWRVLIEGDEEALGLCPWRRKGFDYLISRLFSGGEIAPGALEHYKVSARELGENDEVISVPYGEG